MPATVVHESEVPTLDLPSGAGSYRVPIGPSVGSRHVMQFVVRFRPGAADDVVRKPNEEVLYVVAGAGEITVGDTSYEMAPGVGVFVPPGWAGRLRNTGAEDLHLVIVVSPPFDAEEPGTPAPPEAGSAPHPDPCPAIVRAQDEPVLSAGGDRSFTVLIDPRSGCRTVTQFLRFIGTSPAPLHTHAYEEAIYILRGSGSVHVGRRDHPIHPGTSIFLPPGTPHRLDNRGAGTLALLGVFAPPGSPASRREEGD